MSRAARCADDSRLELDGGHGRRSLRNGSAETGGGKRRAGWAGPGQAGHCLLEDPCTNWALCGSSEGGAQGGPGQPKVAQGGPRAVIASPPPLFLFTRAPGGSSRGGEPSSPGTGRHGATPPRPLHHRQAGAALSDGSCRLFTPFSYPAPAREARQSLTGVQVRAAAPSARRRRL